jgi:hypothetical protein
MAMKLALCLEGISELRVYFDFNYSGKVHLGLGVKRPETIAKH